MRLGYSKHFNKHLKQQASINLMLFLSLCFKESDVKIFTHYLHTRANEFLQQWKCFCKTYKFTNKEKRAGMLLLFDGGRNELLTFLLEVDNPMM